MIFSEIESNREEAVVAYFKALYRLSHGGTEKVHKKPQIMKS
jgi:hypothetical protein